MGDSNKSLGQRGEAAAVRYLEAQCNYEVIERNWVCPAGEADIIAFDGDCLVFIEVKTRRGLKNGFPSESVGQKKRDRYERIAAWYLASTDYVDIQVRFDVIGVLAFDGNRALLRHYVNAFGKGL